MSSVNLSNLIEPLEHRRLLSITPVVENHNNSTNDGVDSNETLLTPTNVNSTDFGKIFDTPLDGQVFAQPLAVPNVDITTGSSQGIHNVLYVATMNDSLYAIDATTGAVLWQDSFLNITNPTSLTPTAGVFTVPGNASPGLNAFVNGSDVGPQLGILSTPVINTATNTLYLAADTQEVRSGSTPVAGTTIAGATTLQANVTADISSGYDIHYVQRIWAINLSNGAVAITASNPSVEPTSSGEVFADTIYDSVNFSKYGLTPNNTGGPGYLYVAGPYVKGTGNNAPTATTSVPGDGWGVNSNDTTSPWGALGDTPTQDNYIAFNAVTQMGRTALTLVNGEIFYGFASHGDDGPYYGWLLGWNATTLATNVAWLSVPTYESFTNVSGDDTDYDAQAGFWNAGSQISTDGTYLYISTGNGAFNPNPSNFSSTFTTTDDGHTVELPLDSDYGDGVLKLQYDPNATQNNINIAGGIINDPNGTYAPDSGYNADGYGLKVVDFFVPSNVYEMNGSDEDLGSSGVTIIPATNPQGQNWLSDGDQMLVTAGKEGRVYLLDTGDLGGYNTTYISDGDEKTAIDPSTFDRVLGEYYYYEAAHPGTDANNQTYKGYDIPSYYDGEIYIGLGGGSPGTKYLPAWQIPVTALLANSSPPDTGVAAAGYVSSTSATFGGRGTTSAISSNGTTNAIVWDTDVTLSSTDDLLAYNFNALTGVNGNGAGTATTLYDSNTNSSRDSLTNGGTIPGTSNTGATGTKFDVPTVFNGMVYDGTGGGSGTSGKPEGTLVGYGLLPSFVQSGSNFAAPTNLAGAVGYPTAINLTWQINSTDEDEFAVQRSTNGGSSWMTLAYVQHGVNSYSDSNVSSGSTYEYRVEAVSGGTNLDTGAATAAITSSFTNTATITIGPTIATPAAANPNPVTGKTTSLSVLGADSLGESSITYTWTVLGTPPATVNFSANGTNGAKNTTATFAAPGTYNFQVTLTDTNEISINSTVQVIVKQALTTVVVSPGNSTLNAEQTEQFAVSSFDQFGNTIGASFHWSTNGGTITNAGILTAPGGSGSYTVTATSGSVSGTATVMVGNTSPVITTVATASPSTISSGGSTTLSVVATDDGGAGNLSYTWTTVAEPNGATAPVFGSVNGTNAGQSTPVTIPTAGNYIFHVTIKDLGGLVVSANVSVVVNAITDEAAIVATHTAYSASNLALQTNVTATSTAVGSAPENIVDGNSATSWTSASAGYQILHLDLGGESLLTHMTLNWGAHYASQYAVQVSANGKTWTTVYETTKGVGGAVNISGFYSTARYARVILYKTPFANYTVDDLFIYGK